MNAQTDPLNIRNVTADDVRPLRAEVLRPGLPFEASFYPGDKRIESAHFGVYQEDALIGCASIFKEDHPDLPGDRHWRIRGMAVDDNHRSKGIGSMLLEACKTHAAHQGAPLVWCYARTRAIRFYIRQGFTVKGEPFDIEGIGEHHLSHCSVP